MMLTNEDFMHAAIKEAVKARAQVPVGAVIVYQDRIISSAHNDINSEDPFAHAEMIAMKQTSMKYGSDILRECTLFVTLEPCPMCAGAMINAKLKQCFFGAYDRQYGCCGSVYHLPMDPVFHHHVPCSGGILSAESERLIKDFFLSKRK